MIVRVDFARELEGTVAEQDTAARALAPPAAAVVGRVVVEEARELVPDGPQVVRPGLRSILRRVDVIERDPEVVVGEGADLEAGGEVEVVVEVDPAVLPVAVEDPGHVVGVTAEERAVDQGANVALPHHARDEDRALGVAKELGGGQALSAVGEEHLPGPNPERVMQLEGHVGVAQVGVAGSSSLDPEVEADPVIDLGAELDPGSADLEPVVEVVVPAIGDKAPVRVKSSPDLYLPSSLLVLDVEHPELDAIGPVRFLSRLLCGVPLLTDGMRISRLGGRLWCRRVCGEARPLLEALEPLLEELDGLVLLGDSLLERVGGLRRLLAERAGGEAGR